MLSELFPAAVAASAAPFVLRDVPTVGQSLLAMPRAALAAGVDLLLDRLPSGVPFRLWQLGAACRGQEESLFFREDNDASRTRRHAFSESRQVCLGCPVRRACLRHALTQPEEFGVWGATHAQQRKAILVRVALGETDLEWEMERCLR